MSFPFFKFLKNYIIRAFKAVHLTCFSFICLGKGKLCTPFSHSAILGRFCALMYMYICICIFQTRRSVKRIYHWNSNSNLNQTWHKAPLSFLWKKRWREIKAKIGKTLTHWQFSKVFSRTFGQILTIGTFLCGGVQSLFKLSQGRTVFPRTTFNFNQNWHKSSFGVREFEFVQKKAPSFKKKKMIIFIIQSFNQCESIFIFALYKRYMAKILPKWHKTLFNQSLIGTVSQVSNMAYGPLGSFQL